MIESINFSLVSSELLKTMGQRLTQIFEPVTETSELSILIPFVLRHTQAYTAFNKAFEREVKNPYTEILAQKDAERDAAFTSFRNYLVACNHRNSEGWDVASTRIIDIIRKHGWKAYSLGYQVETAVLSSIISEVNSKCSAELALLAATEWLNELASAQDAFEEAQNASLTHPGTNGPTIRETRQLLIVAIRSLLTLLDLQYSANSSNAQLAGYVNSVNELIALTMTTARASGTRAENQKKKNEADKQTETK